MAKKANGRARKKANGKAKEPDYYDVGLVPVEGMWKLTPARAKRWLEKEHAGFQSVATMGLRHTEEKEDRYVFCALADSVKEMVKACAAAMAGASVVVHSEIGGPGLDGVYKFSPMERALVILRLPSIAREDINDGAWGESEFDAFDALVRLAERYIKAASSLEFKADKEASFRRRAEVEASHPIARVDAIRERRKALEAERDMAVQGVSDEALDSVESASKAALAAVERVISKAEEPWERQLAYLQYEEDLIWHEYGDCDAKHPGKPPTGYEQQTGCQRGEGAPL